MKSIITFTLLAATVLGLSGISDGAGGLGETNYQTQNDGLGQHDPLQLLPRFYLDAAEELKLTSKQISEIAQKHATYLMVMQQEEEEYGEKLRGLRRELKWAEQNNRRNDVKKYNEAILQLVTGHELLQNRRYAELQKAIMGILPQEKRKKWAGVLFASEAIMPFRWVMGAEQIRNINNMCIRNETIAKVKTLKQRTVMLLKFRNRVKNEILTNEQRTKLWIASYEADKRKKAEKTIPEKNSDEQNSSGGEDSDEVTDSGRNQDKFTKPPSKVPKQKKRSRDEKPRGAGGW